MSQEIHGEEQFWDEGYGEGWREAVLACAKLVCSSCNAGMLPIEKRNNTFYHSFTDPITGNEYTEKCRASEIFRMKIKR